MRKLFFTALLLTLSHTLSAQVSDEYIQAKIDSGWNLLQIKHDDEAGLRIANELWEIAQDQESFTAKINSLQLKGEFAYLNSDLDSALYYYDWGRRLALEEGNQNEVAYATVSIGVIYHELGDYDQSLEEYNLAYKIRKELKDTSNMIFVILKRAWLHNASDRHHLAAEDYMTCIELSKAYNDSINMAYAFDGLGVIHKKQKNYKEARKVHQKSVAIFKELGNQFGESAVRSNMALLFKAQGEFQKAYDMYPPLLEYFQEIGYKQGAFGCITNMAICSNRLGNHKRALTEAKEGLELNQEIQRKDVESDLSNEIGIAYLNLGNLEEALRWSQRSRELAYEGFFKEKQRDSEKTLSDIYEKLGEPDKALFHFKAYKAVYDSIYEKDKSNQVLELQTMFNTAEKEAEIKTLEAKAEVEKVKNRALAFGLIGVLLLSTIIVNREIKRRKKARQLHESELKLANLARERLEDQLAFKNRELTATALHIAQKNEMIQSIKTDLSELKGRDEEFDFQNLFQRINFEKQIDKNWNQFIQAFSETNESFFKNLKANFPKLTKNDLKLCALIQMNMGNKDIANSLNISDDGVKKARYRLRKKMDLDSSESLENALMQLS